MNAALLLILAVAIGAWLLRRAHTGRDDETALSASRIGDDAGNPRDDDGDEEDFPSEMVAVTSEGLAFVPYSGGVTLMVSQRGSESGEWSWNSTADPESPRAPGHQPVERLRKGDLVGARVRKGDPQEPWLVEALGVDRNYRAWSFETEESARAAHQTLDRHVVSTPFGEDGEPSAPSSGDYAEALHRRNMTEQELATQGEDELPG